jgi:hypothetical protein
MQIGIGEMEQKLQAIIKLWMTTVTQNNIKSNQQEPASILYKQAMPVK